jgi:hypothetical protein
MNDGAFALIDCLGFKGLWNLGHEQLVSKLRQVKNTVREGLHNFLSSPGHPLHINPDSFEMDVLLLSDTIAISVRLKQNDNATISLRQLQYEHKWPCLIVTSVIIYALIDLFLDNEPHLLLRGCITYGKHIIEENFLIGPAVDEAAEYMNEAQGAFIWFLPMAAGDIQVILPDNENNFMFSFFDIMCPEYQVPIKGGHYLHTRVINPLFSKKSDVTDNLLSIYYKAMSVDKMDVWMKRQFTIGFLKYCIDKNKMLFNLIEKANAK